MLVRVIVALAFTLAGAEFAAAATATGEAVSVNQSASATGSSGSRVLEVKGGVFAGDVVKTDALGLAQILFRDNTKLVVGPYSEVTLDSFVFGGPTTAKAFSIDAVRGAFRFITGSSQKQAYSIKTPTGTIGVRGTEFDLSIAEDGTTDLALFGGSVRLCDKATPRRHCLVIVGTCSVVSLSPDKTFRQIKSVYDRTDLMNTVFPFAFRQHRLEADFRVESGSCYIPKEEPRPSNSSPPPPECHGEGCGGGNGGGL